MRQAILAALAVIGLAGAPAVALSTESLLPFDPEVATQAWLAAMGDEATARSNAYFEGGYLIGFADTALSILVAGLILVIGWARGVRSWLERTVKWFPLVALGVGFFVNLVSTVLTFPFSYYVNFVREHRYDLSTQTFPEWFREYLMSAGIGLVIGSIFLAILYVIHPRRAEYMVDLGLHRQHRAGGGAQHAGAGLHLAAV